MVPCVINRFTFGISFFFPCFLLVTPFRRVAPCLPPPPVLMAAQRLTQISAENKVLVFSRTVCAYCTVAKNLLTSLKSPYTEINLEKVDDGLALEEALNELTNQYTVPNIFINQLHIGGCDDMKKLHSQGKLVPLLEAAGVLPK